MGGPYLAAHMRRQDFARAHSKDVPSLKNTALQLREKLVEHHLDTVFIATDAPNNGLLIDSVLTRLTTMLCLGSDLCFRQWYIKLLRIDGPVLILTFSFVDKLSTDLYLTAVFIVMVVSEYEELREHLKDFKVFRFQPTEDQHLEYMDGGVAIIDQWICAHARLNFSHS